MFAPNARIWLAAALVSSAASLFVNVEANAQTNRKEGWRATRQPAGQAKSSNAAKDANAADELADDDSKKTKPGDKGKNQKKKTTSKSAQPGGGMRSGRRPAAGAIVRQSSGGGGGGFIGET